MTKANLKEEAIKLRKEGHSYNSIKEKINVSKGSLNLWLREIEIANPLLKKELESQKRAIASRKNGNIRKESAKEIRKIYQEEGRKRALDNNIDHIKACMLYWAEGSKSKNCLSIINTDSDMLWFWITFIKSEFNLEDKNITIRITSYNQNKESSEIYWLNLLNLPKSSLRKGILKINDSPPKYPNGICTIRVNSTKLVQHIYGAIQQYMNIEKPEWLQ